MPTQVRSFAKINLGLSIGPLRPDGFHGLTTIYQTIELHDLVTVEARLTPGRPTAIGLSSNNPSVPTDNRNTARRMVESALAAMGVAAEVHIQIDKRLPVQGGLGAGSANAVAALIGLEAELGSNPMSQNRDMGHPADSGPMSQRRDVGHPLGIEGSLDGQTRLRLAAEIGSDVPLFLFGGTMLGMGRGEEIQRLSDLPPTECVIACPDIGVSTPQAFRDWDAMNPAVEGAAGNLTGPPASDRVEGLSRPFAAVLDNSVQGESHSSGVFSWREGLAENPLLALVRTGIENDFEQVVFPKHPLLGTIKRVLSGSGAASGSPDAAIYAALSGSGSALFGLYATPEAAEAALRRVEAVGVRAFRTQTLPSRDYWRTMVVPG